MLRLTFLTILMSAMISVAAPDRSATVSAAQTVDTRLVARASAMGRVRVIVGLRAFDSGRTAQQDAMQAVASNMRVGTMSETRQLRTLPFFVAEVDAAALQELAASSHIASIVEDVARPPALAQSGPLVEAPNAWEAGYGGAGWTVAVLDTGIDATHPFLYGRVAAEACYSTTDTSGMTSSTSLCPGGLSTASGGGAGAPCSPSVSGCDHGTHVAGIVAGSGGAFSGVARDASILSVQVFSKFGQAECGGMASCVLAWDSDVIEALEHVYSLRSSMSIAAVNLSLGGSLFTDTCDSASPAMTAAIDQLRAAGIATIVAAGNGHSTTGLAFPACVSSAVSVGSTTKDDVISATSNTADFLSLVAPGESIESSVPNGGFGTKTGTSMAAPHVAGAWAVLKQRKPSATVTELLNALRGEGRPVTDGRTGSTFSFPRLRLNAALAAMAVSQPAMAVDTPLGGQVPASFRLSGWAIDRGATGGPGVDSVHIWAYPGGGGSPRFVGAAAPGARRDDIAAAFGAQFRDSGFSIDIGGLASGTYTLVAFAHSSVSGTFNQSRTVDVTVPTSWPAMALDGPANPATVARSFVVCGWAVDRMAPTSSGVDAVHVWAFPASGGDPIFVGQASYGGSRDDVGNVYGRQFDLSGFGLTATLAPGTYDLVVYAHSTVAGTFNQARVARVTVRD